MNLVLIIFLMVILLLSFVIIIYYRKINFYKKNFIKIDDILKFNSIKEEHIEEFTREFKSVVKYLLNEKRNLIDSRDELERYKDELKKTHNILLSKSTELEYTNNLLEKRLTNISTLNAIGKSVLSEFDLNKIISIILDTYVVLLGISKISLYLWENKELVNIANKGDIDYNEDIEIDIEKYDENIKGIKLYNIKKEYLEIAHKIKSENEKVYISEIKMKDKELGAVFLLEENISDKKIGIDMETASALALYVAIAINNYIIYVDLSEKERMEKEIAIAAEIQKSLIPDNLKNAFGLEISNYFEPAREVGGDYYDYFISAEGKFGVTIGDVSGKGIPAALLMATIRAILKTLSYYENLPNEALRKLNEILMTNISKEMFVTIFFAIFDTEEKKVLFSNAGHNPFLHYNKKTDSIEEVKVKGVAVGFLEEYEYSLGEIDIGYEDIMVFYTDGVTEAENEKRELFGLNRLKETLDENKEKSAEEIKKSILNEVFKFRGAYEQVDDITLIVMKHKR